MSVGTILNTNFIINIDGIDVYITEIKISNGVTQIQHGNSRFMQPPQYISIKGEISNNNYYNIDKWFNGILNNPNIFGVNTYKKDIVFNTIKIFGIFPTDYTFNQNGIDVTFSADYISGDLHLFQTKQLRKAKLEKLNKINV
jgi:hypothetical protein